MALPKPSSPRAAWTDFKAFLVDQPRHKWVILLLSIAMPAILVTVFMLDSQTGMQMPKQVVFVESWPANRTDEEIKAQQIIDQKARDEAKLRRQQDYQRLQKRLGIE